MYVSHHLRIESGRWNRPPTPREDRLCVCGTGVQTEEPVLLRCPRTDLLRLNFNVSNETESAAQLFQDMNEDSLANFISRCLEAV